MHDILAIFYIHNDFIEGNERSKLGGEDLEKLKISKFLKLFKTFYYFKTPIFQIYITFNTLEVLTFRDPIPRDVEVRAS